MYMLWGGNKSGVYVSTNKGATWTQIRAITSSVPGPNAAKDAYWGQMIVINPLNDGEAYIGIPGGGGLWHVTGHTSATRLDPGTIPSASSGKGYYGICWLGNTIIIPIYGTGAYISTNGGSSWAASSGAPTEIFCGCFGSDGTYYCLVKSAGEPYRLLSATWASIYSGTSDFFASITVDPANAAHVAMNEFDGQIVFSTNANSASAGSVSWSYTAVSEQVNSSDVPWISWSFRGQPTASYLNMNAIAFDNAVANKIWGAIGVGVIYCTSQPTSGTITWTSMTAGQETLVASWICWPPGGPPIVNCWDRTGFCIQNPDSPQSEYIPDNGQTIRRGTATDYAKNNPSFLVTLSTGGSGTVEIFTASDGGLSNAWTAISTQPQSNYDAGALAVMDANHWAYMDSFGGTGVYVTANGGRSWTQNPSSLPPDGWRFFGFGNPHPITADYVTAGKIYAYNNAHGSSPGVYSSTNYGASWTRVHSGSLKSGADGASPIMKAVPGQAGNLFWTTGNNGTPSAPTNYLQYSADGGVTWSNVTNSSYRITDVWTFGFSAPAPGQRFPSILVYGWLSTNGGSNYKLSFWRCDNFDAGISSLVWTDMGYPFNSVDQTTCIEGNPDVYNQWIRGAQGTGFVYYGPGRVTW